MKSTFLLHCRWAVSAAAICALLSVTAHAQAPAAPGGTPAAATPTPRPKPLAYTDEHYIDSALKSMSYLVQLANAAKTAITDPNLARLRDSTANDLGTAMTELKKIAEAHGLKPPATELAGTEKFEFDQLSKAKPDKYPKQWVEAVFKEAKKLDHDTEMNGKTAQSDEMKTFFTSYTPLIHNVFTVSEAADKAAKAPVKH